MNSPSQDDGLDLGYELLQYKPKSRYRAGSPTCVRKSNQNLSLSPTNHETEPLKAGANQAGA